MLGQLTMGDNFYLHIIHQSKFNNKVYFTNNKNCRKKY